MRYIASIIMCIFFNFPVYGQKKNEKKKNNSETVDNNMRYLQMIQTLRDTFGTLAEQQPCSVLALMQDSVFLDNFPVRECMNAIIGELERKSGIDAKQTKDFDGIYYSNLSLGKSLYKHDLILWNRYFGCPDTIALKNRKYGSFNGYERHIIKSDIEKNKYNPHIKRMIDTAILD